VGVQEQVLTAILALMHMMIPPGIRRTMNAGGTLPAPVMAKGEQAPKPGNSQASAKAARKRSSSSRSATGGAQKSAFGS
jgi:hypothetical protein